MTANTPQRPIDLAETTASLLRALDREIAGIMRTVRDLFREWATAPPSHRRRRRTKRKIVMQARARSGRAVPR